MSTIRFINCFEVPRGKEDEFLRLWREVNAYMRAKPGYLGHRLHRSISDESMYRFVNYVEWASLHDLDAAHDAGFRALVGKPGWRGIISRHAPYEVWDEFRAERGPGEAEPANEQRP